MNPRKLILLFVFYFTFQALYAQKKQIKGVFANLNGRQGIVNAQVEIKNGDTILNGEFEFVITKELPGKNIFFKEIYKGNYNQGLKDGTWDYEHALLNYKVLDIKNEKLVTTFSGSKELLDAHYKKSFPDGIWHYSKYQIDSNRVNSIEEIGQLNFKSGIPNGAFQFKNMAHPGHSLSGTFDSLGRLDGEWQITYFQEDTIQETRIYDHGFLTSILLKKSNAEDTIDYLRFESVINKLANSNYSVAKSGHNIQFNDGYLKDDREIQIQNNGNTLLADVYEKFLRSDLGDGALPGAKHNFEPGTSRFIYELPFDFNADIALMIERLREIKNQSDSILKAQKFFINQNKTPFLSESNEILVHYIQKSEAILMDLVQPNDTSYQFMDPDIFFNRIYEKHIRNIDTITYYYDDEQKYILFDIHTEKDLAPFSKLVDAIKILKIQYAVREKEIASQLERITQEEYLAALEADIQFNTALVERKFSTDGASLKMALLNNVIDPWFSKQLQLYSNTEEIKKRQQVGRYLLNVVQIIGALESNIDSIKIREQLIDSAYTDYVFDPYTYSAGIKKRIKKRLYDAVAVEYYNKKIADIQRLNDASQLESQIFFIEKLQKRLIELSKESTKSLEKKFKKSNSEEDIIKWLDLEG